MTPDLPGGTVTFLFTDIQGSTPLWEREPAAMRQALARHNAILRRAVEAQSGHVYKVIGDAIQAAFVVPADAATAAIAAQRELAGTTWPTSTPLRVRMGLHTGPAEPAGADYAATHTLNRAARITPALAAQVQVWPPPMAGRSCSRPKWPNCCTVICRLTQACATWASIA